MKALGTLKWLICHGFLKTGSFQVGLAGSGLDHKSPSIPGLGSYSRRRSLIGKVIRPCVLLA